MTILTVATEARNPIVFLGEVEKLVDHAGVSKEALARLGAKAREGNVDLKWLNQTSITDKELDFLARDKRTPWNLYSNPAEQGKRLRISLRGAGAELEAEPIVEGLGTNVKRQVKMGTSEIDYEVTIAGKPRGFEVKGWTADTWEEALDAAIKRLNKKGLTAAEKKGVQKIDHMLGQLQNAQAAKGASPYRDLNKF